MEKLNSNKTLCIKYTIFCMGGSLILHPNFMTKEIHICMQLMGVFFFNPFCFYLIQIRSQVTVKAYRLELSAFIIIFVCQHYQWNGAGLRALSANLVTWLDRPYLPWCVSVHVSKLFTESNSLNFVP